MNFILNTNKDDELIIEARTKQEALDIANEMNHEVYTIGIYNTETFEIIDL